jgi:hypothetical protein
MMTWLDNHYGSILAVTAVAFAVLVVLALWGGGC